MQKLEAFNVSTALVTSPDSAAGARVSAEQRDTLAKLHRSTVAAIVKLGVTPSDFEEGGKLAHLHPSDQASVAPGMRRQLNEVEQHEFRSKAFYERVIGGPDARLDQGAASSSTPHHPDLVRPVIKMYGE